MKITITGNPDPIGIIILVVLLCCFIYELRKTTKKFWACYLTVLSVLIVEFLIVVCIK